MEILRGSQGRESGKKAALASPNHRPESSCFIQIGGQRQSSPGTVSERSCREPRAIKGDFFVGPLGRLARRIAQLAFRPRKTTFPAVRIGGV